MTTPRETQPMIVRTYPRLRLVDWPDQSWTFMPKTEEKNERGRKIILEGGGGSQ